MAHLNYFWARTFFKKVFKEIKMIFDRPDVAKSSDSAFLEALLYEPISVALVIIQKKRKLFTNVFLWLLLNKCSHL